LTKKGGSVKAFLHVFVAFVAASSMAAIAAEPAFETEIECGAVWQSHNEVAIPNGTGTRFSMADLLGRGPYAAGRIYATWRFLPKHEICGLLAPLEINDSGILPKTTVFNGVTFDPFTPTDATYRFDSYRLTYRYLLWDAEGWKVKVGITGKIRDAEISLAQSNKSSSYDNTGFVPLLNLAVEKEIADQLDIVVDIDGLASSQGRAFDISAKMEYEVAPGLSLSFGYRMVEGGADNDDVYTFAWLQYAVVAATAKF
jgi:hypothetical protein